MKKKRRLLQSDMFWGLAAAGLVLLQFWWLPGEDGSAADSYSTTVDGKLGLFRTLSELFPRVERDSLNVVPGTSSTMLLIAPDRYPGEQEQQQIYEFVYQGGNLLFVPNENQPNVSVSRLGISFSERTGQFISGDLNTTVIPTESVSPGDELNPGSGVSVPSEVVEVGPEETGTTEPTGTVRIRSNARLNVTSLFSTETLMRSSEGVEAATWMLGSGRVVVCASPDLFSNRSMLFKESRRLAVRLVERCARNADDVGMEADTAIVISEYFNASDSYQNTGVLFSPVLRIGTLQLLLVAVLGIWMAFYRFGPAIDVTTMQRRSLRESAQAIGNLQYRLRDGGASVRGYLDYMRSQLRRRHGSLLRLDQAEALANRAGMNADEVREKLKEAKAMAESSQLSAARAAAMLRWLSHLHQRLSGLRNSVVLEAETHTTEK